MKVYRVVYEADHPANSSGVPRGPYTIDRPSANEHTEKLHGRLMREHSNAEHPTPFTDGDLFGIGAAEYCCFESIEKMASWFENFGYDLTAAGCVIMIMEADESDVRIGIKQAVVRQDGAKVISVESPLGYIE